MTLLEQRDGHYHFVPNGVGSPYCRGVVAAPGYEVVHATLRRSIPWREGFAFVDRYLASIGRPGAALCAVDLLKSRGLFVDGENPVARTNVVPRLNPPAEQVLFAFSYTVPTATGDTSPTFVAAGSGEDPSVYPKETSTEALRAKTRNVMAEMRSRLSALGARWEDVTAVDLYTVHDFGAFIREEVLEQIGPAARQGIHWYDTRPPIDDREVEVDLRGVRQEARVEA